MYCLRALRRVALLFVLGACGATQALAKDCVGVVSAGDTPFWQQVEAGTRQAGRDLGVDVYFRGPSREGRVESQLQMIDWVESLGCKVLVIAPSGAGIAQRVRELEARGIATIYFDRDLAGSPVRGLVSTDNFRAGQQAGQYLATKLGGTGQVAILRLQPGVHSTSERERGFRQAAEAGGLLILVDTYVGEDSQAVVSALQRELTHLDGLFTPNSTTSRAALAGLRRLHKAGQLLHVGFDGDQLLLEALRQGDIHGLFIQQTHAIGYQAVKLAAQALRGELPATPVSIQLDVWQLDRDNLAEWQRARALELSAQP